MLRHEVWQQLPQVPVSAELVNDPTLEWPVAGSFKRLCSDAEFTAAFSNLDSIPKSWKPVTRASFIKCAGWKQEQAIKALNAPVAHVYRFPHAEVEAVADFEKVDWSACVGVERSADGSEGVIFVELPGKRAVVVKAPLYVASEMFGNLLCARLGLKCPNVRLVKSGSAEGKLLVQALIKADALQYSAEHSVEKMIDGRPLLLVIEYVQATELANVLPPASQVWSKAAFGLDPSGSLSEHGKEFLRALGSLVAFDMIINNFDRLPCVWDNQGNPGNIMVTKAAGGPISVDNQVCCIHSQNEKAIAKYMERIQHVVADCILHVDAGVEQSEFARIRSFLKDGCVEGHGWTGLQIDVGVEGTLEVQTGFLNLVYFAVYGDSGADDEGVSLEWLEAVRDGLLQQLPGENPLRDGPKHMYGFGTIHPQFCVRVVDTFQRAIEQVADETGINKALTARRIRKPLTSTGMKGENSGVIRDGDRMLPMFMSPEMQQTFLEYYDRRKPQLKADAAHMLKMKFGRAREEAGTSPKNIRSCAAKGYFPIELLTCLPPWPEGVQGNCRELYLSPEDFQGIFGMDKASFGKLPLWTQQFRKKKANLF